MLKHVELSNTKRGITNVTNIQATLTVSENKEFQSEIKACFPTAQIISINTTAGSHHRYNWGSNDWGGGQIENGY